MISKLAIVGIVGDLAYAMIKGHDYYSRLAYRFVGYKITDIDLTDQPTFTLLLSFQIYNPTPVTLTVNSVVGNVFVNNYYVGQLNNNIEQIIQSDNVSTVTLRLQADAKRVGVVALGELIKNKYSNLLVRLDGSVTVESITIPVTIAQTL